METWGNKKYEHMVAKKPTKFMTNSEGLAAELCRRCDGSHKHQTFLGGRAAEAARYPTELCRARCRGLIRDMKSRVQKLSIVAECKAPDDRRKTPDPEQFHEEEEAAWARGGGLCKLGNRKESNGLLMI